MLDGSPGSAPWLAVETDSLADDEDGMYPGTSMVLFHTGMVVPDLEQSMSSLGGVLKLDWAPPRIADSAVWAKGNIVPRRVEYTYSIQGPPFVELMQLHESTAHNHLTGGSDSSHLGFFAHDFARAVDSLEESGYPRELSSPDLHGSAARLSLHFNPAAPGMYIEVLSAGVAREIDEWLSAAAADRGLDYTSFVSRTAQNFSDPSD